MADAISIDTREVAEFAADLGRISGRVLPEVDVIMKHAADNIKDELATDAKASRHFKRMAAAMSYDSHYRVGQVAYEIGPDRARGGAGRAARLANIAYFGGANGGGGKLSLDAPLDHEEPRTMKHLDTLLAGLL